MVCASPDLHRPSGLEACYPVRWYALGTAVHYSCPIGVGAGEVEEVDTREDDEKPAEEGDGIDWIGGVEAPEEDE